MYYTSIHPEIGATQMVLELVHRFATDDCRGSEGPRQCDFPAGAVAESDGNIVTDWYNKVQGMPYEATLVLHLYHNHTGHDNNCDMYLFSQKEAVTTGVWQTGSLIWLTSTNGDVWAADFHDAGNRPIYPM